MGVPPYRNKMAAELWPAYFPHLHNWTCGTPPTVADCIMHKLWPDPHEWAERVCVRSDYERTRFQLLKRTLGELPVCVISLNEMCNWLFESWRELDKYCGAESRFVIDSFFQVFARSPSTRKYFDFWSIVMRAWQGDIALPAPRRIVERMRSTADTECVLCCSSIHAGAGVLAAYPCGNAHADISVCAACSERWTQTCPFCRCSLRWRRETWDSLLVPTAAAADSD